MTWLDALDDRRVQIGLLLAAAFGVRWVAHPGVMVNGDTGLYLYDAKQLIWGRQLYVDFPSRSPLFHYLLAPWVWAFESEIHGARAMMMLIGVALTGAVYWLGREVRGHRAGMLSAGLFALTPFSVVWGLWVKTEQAAAIVLIVVAVLLLKRIDQPRLSFRFSVFAGVLFAGSYLLRRSAVVIMGAIGLFIVLYRWDKHDEIIPTLVVGTLMVASTLGTLAVSYYLLAYGDLAIAAEIARQHLIGLFATSGHGGIEWVGLDQTAAVTQESRDGLWYLLCPKCGSRTASVFYNTALVCAPVIIVLLGFFRAYTREAHDMIANPLLPAALAVLPLFQVPLLLQRQRHPRVVALFVWAAAVVYVWWLPAVDWEDVWTPRLGLPIAVLLALTSGYLVRDRILYQTYFQDFYPWLVVVAGVTLTVYIDRLGIDGSNLRPSRELVMGAIVFIAAMGVAGTFAIPYHPGGPPDDVTWVGVDDVETFGNDVEARTASNQTVLAAQPLYTVGADRKIAANMSRKYYVYHIWPDSEAEQRVNAELIEQFETGTIGLVIIGSDYQVINTNPTIQAIVETCFEPVSAPDYERTGATVYEPTGGYPACAREVTNGSASSG